MLGEGQARERMITVNGAQLWVAEQGSGPPMVLCTGGAGLCDYLGPVATMVDDLAQVYRFDPRGCGRSSATPPYDMATMLGDLEALRATLGHEQWVVGGHSFGADLGLAYALEHPHRVRGLLYISGTGVQDDRQWHAAYEVGRAAGRDPLPAFDYPFNPEVNKAVNASWRATIKQPLLLRRLSELRVPLLALHGSADVRPSWPVEQLALLVTNARFESIEGASHCPWLTHAGDLRDRMRSFLSTLPPQVYLTTARLVLRRFTLADADNLFDLDSDPAVMRFLTGGAPTPRYVIEQDILPAFLRSYDSHDGFGVWAAMEKASEAFLGWFSLRPREGGNPGEVALGYRLHRAAWGQGYATEGVRALIHVGFTTLGVQRVVATIYQDNQASRRVMEKAGLRLVRTYRFTAADLAAQDTYHGTSQDLWDGDDVEYALDKADWS